MDGRHLQGRLWSPRSARGPHGRAPTGPNVSRRWTLVAAARNVIP